MALALVGGLAACDGSSADPDPTLPPPTTTTTIDVSKVPPTIDVPYVQAVMDTLDRLTGDAVRVLVANKLPNAEFFALLHAIYDEPEFSRTQSEFGNYAVRGLTPLSPNPGNPKSLIRRVIDSSSTCIVAELDHDYGPIFRERSSLDDRGGFIQLRSKNPQRDPTLKNPTAWAIVADIDTEGAQIPEDPCR